jgi:hypothetical protein
MKLSGLHILLTYQCNFECDHCFVWGSPQQAGVFTLEQLGEVFRQAVELNTIEECYFEGGETFIYYPVVLKAVASAAALGFTTGVVTNGYWATGPEDAVAWLRPLVEAGLDRLEISYDLLHGHQASSAGFHAGLLAAEKLGLSASLITVEAPTGYRDPAASIPGAVLEGGDVMFRGRAAAKLTPGLPRRPWDTLTSCPYEDLANPGRIHLDPFGNLHLCQGLVMGNIWEQELSQIVASYEPGSHPIVAPLLAGGPAELARRHNLSHEPGYVDACHFCYEARLALRHQYPAYLAPDQMYGVMSSPV